MKLLENALKEKKFDIRMKDKNLQRGIIQYSDVVEYYDTLKDDSDLADYTELEPQSSSQSDSSSSH